MSAIKTFSQTLADPHNGERDQAVADLVLGEMEKADRELVDDMVRRGYELRADADPPPKETGFCWLANSEGAPKWRSPYFVRADELINFAVKVLQPDPAREVEWLTVAPGEFITGSGAVDATAEGADSPIDGESQDLPASVRLDHNWSVETGDDCPHCLTCGIMKDHAISMDIDYCQGSRWQSDPTDDRAGDDAGGTPALPVKADTFGDGVIALANIVLDAGTQSRCELDMFHIEDLATALRAGKDLPKILVFYDDHDHRFYLADGFHRVEAYRKVGIGKLPCDFQPGTLRDAILYSLGANADHGLKRSNDDKRKAVRTMLEDEEWRTWSNNLIAETVKVSDTFVSEIRRKMEDAGELEPQTVRKGKSGRVIDTQGIGDRGQGIGEEEAPPIAVEAAGSQEPGAGEQDQEPPNIAGGTESAPAEVAASPAPDTPPPDASVSEARPDSEDAAQAAFRKASVTVTIEFLPADGHLEGRQIMLVATEGKTNGVLRSKMIRAHTIASAFTPLSRMLDEFVTELGSRVVIEAAKKTAARKPTKKAAKKPTIRTCEICGCTNDTPCPGGCSWIAPKRCSACKGKKKPAAKKPPAKKAK